LYGEEDGLPYYIKPGFDVIQFVGIPQLHHTGYGYIVGSIFRRYLFLFWYTELWTETYIKACTRQIVIEGVKQEKSTAAIEPLQLLFDDFGQLPPVRDTPLYA
jgi:hypothetical protein